MCLRILGIRLLIIMNYIPTSHYPLLQNRRVELHCLLYRYFMRYWWKLVTMPAKKHAIKSKKVTPQTAPAKFEFIVSNAFADTTRSVDTTRLIKRPVMFHHIRQSKLSTGSLTGDKDVPLTLSDGSPGNGTGTFKLSSWKRNPAKERR